MRFSIERGQIDKLFAQRNSYLMLAMGSLCLSMLLVVLLFFTIGREKIVIVPPQIDKSFWVSGSHVSPEYLSDMTTFFAGLRLNITPESAETQRETLLRYVDPVYYNTLKEKLIEEADRITAQHMILAFYPVNVKVDTKHFKAMITGDLKSSVGDSSLPTKRITYLVTYCYDAGKLLVTAFEEVKNESV